MKRLNIPFRTLLLPALLFCSCLNEVDFTAEERSHKLVLNSVITRDARITANVYESTFFLDDISAGTYNSVRSDAKVSLWCNGEHIEDLQRHYNDNFFYTPYANWFKPGDLVELRAEAEGLPAVAGRAEIPAEIEITQVDVETKRYELNIHNYEDTYVEHQCGLTFHDNPAEENYYRLLVELKCRSVDGYDYLPAYTLQLDDPVFEVEADGTGGYLDEYLFKNRYHIFSDRTFNGKDYTLRFSFAKTKDEYDQSQGFVKQFAEINLQHISKDYYLHLKTREASELKELIPALFTEPIQIYSNIENGLGLMGVYINNKVTKEIPLK